MEVDHALELKDILEKDVFNYILKNINLFEKQTRMTVRRVNLIDTPVYSFGDKAEKNILGGVYIELL